MSDPILEILDLTVRRGLVEAVRGVSLRVGRGRIATLIGPNGAGKTTLLSAAAGLLPASAGEVRLDGAPLGGATVEENVRRGLCLVPETRELFTAMSVEDNLLLGGYTRRREPRASREARFEEVYQLFPRLRERRAQLAGTLSGGERQMLALGRALMAAPRVLLLDEPSLGLAPRVVREVLEAVAALRDRGASILLVEQNARAALRIADDAYVMEGGEIALAGPATELARDPRVVASYLGTGAGGPRLP
jgi:branched-chain amino acid transport system ATP-binding protein